MEIETFVYKPVYIQAVPVTEENMAEVAAWCGGQILKQASKFVEGKEAPYIKVDVVRPINPRQAQAFVGDRVIKLNNDGGWKVYTPKAFEMTFNKVTEDAVPVG